MHFAESILGEKLAKRPQSRTDKQKGRGRYVLSSENEDHLDTGARERPTEDTAQSDQVRLPQAYLGNKQSEGQLGLPQREHPEFAGAEAVIQEQGGKVRVEDKEARRGTEEHQKGDRQFGRQVQANYRVIHQLTAASQQLLRARQEQVHRVEGKGQRVKLQPQNQDKLTLLREVQTHEGIRLLQVGNVGVANGGIFKDQKMIQYIQSLLVLLFSRVSLELLLEELDYCNWVVYLIAASLLVEPAEIVRNKVDVIAI